MKFIIIEIDGYVNQVILRGRKCSKQQLKQMYFQVKELTRETSGLPNIFCRLYNFEQISYSEDIEVDFVIDLDTDRIYSPSY